MYLSLVSNVCITSGSANVLGPQQTQQTTRNAFQISTQPDWQIDNGFFLQTGHSWRIIKSWKTGGGRNKDFSTVSQTDLTKKFSFISSAGYSGIVKMGMKRRGSGREIRLC